jgi:cytochrome c-type biogenesis protein CcmH/NrfG
MGSFAKVTYYLEAYLQTHPGDTSVMFALAALYMKDGRLGQSKAMLGEVLLLDPANRDAANLLEEVEHISANTEPRPAAVFRAPSAAEVR